MAKQLRVGLVGVGQRGLNHLQQLVRLQSEEIGTFAALADPFAENLSRGEDQTVGAELR